MKDEQNYLAEWLTYHQSIGFDHFFLFEDYNSQPHDYIINGFRNVDLVRFEDIHGYNINYGDRQCCVYRYALEKLKKEQ